MRSNNINKAVQILKQGGVVVYPTDTAYGLAVDATNVAAVRKLYQLKGRDFRKPIHIIPPSKSSIGLFARINPLAKKVMDKFMPGPLTVVLPLKAEGNSWQQLSARTKTIGIRIPNHPTAQALVKALKRPITTTSANISGAKNTYSIANVRKQFAKSKLKPDFYLDGGKLKQIKPSTVVLLTGKRVKILRQGSISETQINKVLK